MKYLKILGFLFVSSAVFLGARSAIAASPLPLVPGVFETSLAAPEATTDTSLTLVNGNINGLPFTGYTCFTVDAGQTTFEYECGNVSGTSVINLQRGVDTLYGTSTIASQVFSHRRGADVRITDFPFVSLIQQILNGSSTLPFILSYSPTTSTSTLSGGNIPTVAYVISQTSTASSSAISTILGSNNVWTGTNAFGGLVTHNAGFVSTASSTFVTTVNAPYSTASTSVASVGYVNATAFAGVPNASLTAKGVSQLATPAQINAGTASGSSAAALVVTPDALLQSNYASSTSQFKGNGSDGALNISSGTTTIDLGGSAYVVKNYTSISITGTGALSFTNASSTGTYIELKSQGNCTLTSSSNGMIDASTTGSAAGIGGNTSFTNPGATGTVAYIWNGTPPQAGQGGQGDSASVTAGGTAGTKFLLDFIIGTNEKYVMGAGGGGGGAGQSSLSTGPGLGAIGGRGAGVLKLNCGGSLNFTTGGINVGGSNGSRGVAGNGSVGDGAGSGGGGGGTAIVLYNSLTANSGTINVNGGTGGVGLAVGSLNGGSGGGGGGSLTSGGTGGGGNTGLSGAGGIGGNGISFIGLNTEYQ